MKIKYLLFIAFLLTIFSCNTKNEGSNRDNRGSSPFAGNWISLTYRDSLDKYSTPGKVKNADLEELIINFSVDSVCLNLEGVETPVFKIASKNENTFIVKKFNQDDFTEFTLSEDGKELSYIYKKMNRTTRFFKAEQKYAVKVINGWSTAARLYFNERILAANFYLLNSEAKPVSDIAFTSYGKIVGLQAYTNYNICYQGDCRSMTDGDLITLSDGKTSDNFIYEWNNGTLVFYSVTNIAGHDEMPQYIKGAEIFRFLKRM